ncbi:MAG: bifunctional enoyl-CoA hydratase/phosphate acetyltransferase [Pseudomonadota bacterium]
MNKAPKLTNKTFDELQVGDEASIERLCRIEDFYVFANASGNHNPLHLPELDGDGDGKAEALAPAMWVGSLVSAVLGNLLPGPGTRYRAQHFAFHAPACAGDTLTVSVKVTSKADDGRLVGLATTVVRGDGTLIADGEAQVLAPQAKVSLDGSVVPGLTVRSHVHFDALLDRARPLEPIPTAVVAPESEDALEGALLGAQNTLITPILVGDPEKIADIAKGIGADLSAYSIEPARTHDEAAARAVALVHEGKAQALMKGHLHTDELLGHVVKSNGGLRTKRRLSHVFVMDVPGLDHLLLITDAAINIAPDLSAKADITQNAIYLAHALGMPEPRVGILSAVETVNPKMPSTLDAAALSKMADRGQITGGIVDGPLAMDNAMSVEAARTKGLHSLVAGHAEILVVPNLEAGNMMAKELTFLAHAEAGGIVLGARCPIILNSRADDEKARLASCAVAALVANHAADEAAH